jgi:hypothetical protein
VSNDDIPEDDTLTRIDAQPSHQVKKTNNVSTTQVENVKAPTDDLDINDLTEDPDNAGLDLPDSDSSNEKETSKSDDVDAEDLLADLDI